MMLTGIYVCNATTTLTFTTSEAVTLYPYDTTKSPIVPSGSPLQASVPVGIYKIESNDSVQTKCTPTSAESNITVFESPNVKDPTPDPPGQARVLYTTPASLTAFFVRPDSRSAGFPTSTR